MRASTDRPRSEAGAEDASRARGRWRSLPRWARWSLLALGVLCALAAVLAALSGPLVRREVSARAAALGLDVEVAGVRVGLGRVRLSGVRVSARDVPSVSAAVDRIDVKLGFGLGAVEAHGGRVRVTGSVEDVAHELAQYRARRPKAKPGAARGAAVPVSIDGVDVIWDRARGDRAVQRAWGLAYTRRADGAERAAADLVRLELGGNRLEIRGATVGLVRQGGDTRVLSSASAGRITAVVDLDEPLGEQDAAAETVPAAIQAGPAPAQKTILRGVDTGKDPSRKTAAAALDQAKAEVGRAVRDRIAKAAAVVARALAQAGKVEFQGARLEVHREGQVLNVGPAAIVLARKPDRLSLAVTSGAAEGSTPMRLELDAPVDRGPVDVALTGGPLSLSALGVKENDMGLLDVGRSVIEVSGRARLSEDGSTVSVSGQARLSDLALYQPKIAPDPVRGLRLGVSGDADLRVDGSHALLRDVDLAVGKVHLRMNGEIQRADGDSKGSLRAEIPLVACSDLVASVPTELAPLVTGVKVAGTFAFSADLAFDTRRAGDTRTEWNVANECRVTEVPAELSPDKFKRPWVRTVLGADGVPTTIESGPGTPGWVPLYDISPYVQTAVIVCEDSRFFTHDGFDGKAISDSIRDNLRAGRFVRGASTVSMQLAKNLYLGREKTLSRKLQEAGLTVLLEQAFGKEQLLELYLNVIEFAPGVYGIGPAAQHYFRSAAKDLSLAQSLYLVSILPNPKNHHLAPDGTLSPKWDEYLKKLMAVAHKIHRIDDRELEAGLTQTVQFGVPAAESTREEGSAPPDVLDWMPGDAPAPEDPGP